MKAQLLKVCTLRQVEGSSLNYELAVPFFPFGLHDL